MNEFEKLIRFSTEENAVSQPVGTSLPAVDPCQPIEERIAICAYFIWRSEGSSPGREREHWTQAEEQLRLCCWHDVVHGSLRP